MAKYKSAKKSDIKTQSVSGKTLYNEWAEPHNWEKND